GPRGTGMWGRQLLRDHGERIELVGLHDRNSLRLAAAREAIATDAPAFSDLAEMLRATRPDALIVCTRDDTHAGVIVAGLEAGADAMPEKPMATTSAMCRQILAAEERTGKRVDVTFNYRFSPTSRKIKELLASDRIGEVVSVDFHWYLDTAHGADYFRRWHAFMAHSGSLFV